MAYNFCCDSYHVPDLIYVYLVYQYFMIRKTFRTIKLSENSNNINSQIDATITGSIVGALYHKL